MSRVKVKKVMPKGSGEDVQMLNSMFDQMTGTSHADPDILCPKFLQLRVNVMKFHKVFKLFLNLNNFSESFPECNDSCDEIDVFLKKIEALGIGVGDSEDEKKVIEAMDKKELNDAFNDLKNSYEVQQIIITSSALGKHKKHISDKDALSDEFIKREPGLSMIPLSFSSLDLKKIWVSDNCTDMTRKFILSILCHAYNAGYGIYDLVTSPNIDIKKFSHVLINNIGMLKKQIPRCDKAFNIISDSVKMLECNFKDYYKTSVEAENPSIIIESFIVDVSMKQKSNATITRQFRKIIMYMKKKSANNEDPRVKKLFSILNNQFSMMEKETPGYVKPDNDSDSDPDIHPGDPTEGDPTEGDPTEGDPTEGEAGDPDIHPGDPDIHPGDPTEGEAGNPDIHPGNPDIHPGNPL